MITLALDTTGAWCSCALVNEYGVLADLSENIGRGHAERLAPMVAETLLHASITPKDIDRVVACTGPGSFTGLRVALAFARSFALPLKIPVIGLSALQAMAAEADPNGDQAVIAAINAKRGDICWGAYKNGYEVHSPRTQPVDDAKSAIDQLAYDAVVGDGAALMGFEAVDIDHARAPILAWIGAALDPANYPPEPFYARGPDAKLPGGKSLA